MDDPIVDEFHPLIYKANFCPDTMYINQALHKNGWDQFIEDIQKEVQAHLDQEYFKVVHKSKIPKRTLILPSI